MSASKHFDRIALCVTALMLVITVLFMGGGALGIEAITKASATYSEKLFDRSYVHTIDISMSNWDKFIENATSEEYYAADVIIDGEVFKSVAIRAKGNTSLSTVASLGSERYSFKIEFDHYDKTKLYHGLDKLSLNNLIQDSTMMKDYLTYTLMNEFQVNSSLSSFVYITVNGEDWGLYLAVEGVEEAFLERNYGSDYGELYKPDSMSFGGGRGNGKDFDFKNFNSDSDDNIPELPSGDAFEGNKNFDPSDLPSDFDPSNVQDEKKGKGDFGGGKGDFGSKGSSDVKLQYIDDSLDSYSNIWDNAKTDITDSDKQRLISSLKKLSSNEDIDSIVDVEQVIRYFVVHNYVCNGDSYTGSMVHNYYLYEKDGKMAMIPWDYNLAFGTFQENNANSTVNTPIDSPVDSGSSEDRPMWNWIVSNEEYTTLYHEFFSEFLENTDIQKIISDAYEMIKGYVEKDPTAFYSYDEFEKGVETLKQFCSLRSESISKQIENGETSTTVSYADASSINLSDMGSMGGGIGRDNTNAPTVPEMPTTSQDSTDSTRESESATQPTPSMPSGDGNGTPPEMPNGGQMPSGDGGTPPAMPNGGQMPNGDGGTPPAMPNGFSL